MKVRIVDVPYLLLTMKTAPSLIHLRPENFPEETPVMIEIPEGTSIKYELDKKSGVLVVDRFLHTAMVYPFNYGFVPDTKADDGDPVDVVLISGQAVAPGCIVRSRPIGLLEMEDEEGLDEKLLCVPSHDIDRWYDDIKDVNDIDKPTREKIRHFFTHYKELEKGKWVKIRDFAGRERALEILRKSAI